MPKHRGAIKDQMTGEWWFNGRWYDHYPAKEIEDYNGRMDEWAERKWEARKERKS